MNRCKPDGAGGSLVSLLNDSVAAYAERTAIVFDGRTTTFSALGRLTDRVASGLTASGIRPGDRIGLYCANSDFFAIAYFGILKAGAIVVPVNLMLHPKEAAFILQDAEARALIYLEALAPAVQAIKPLCSLEFGVCMGTNKADPLDVLLDDWLNRPAGEVAAPAVNPEEDLAVILYTSGTTGRPKGAMLTHRNLVSNVRSVRRALQLTPGGEIFLVVLPMFHAFAATASMLFPLLHGCTVVPLPRFEPLGVAEAIARERVTVFMGVPSLYSVLLRLPDELTPKFASLRLCISGGAALPVEVMKQFEARFGKPIYEGDGPTECSPVTCVNPIGGSRKPGTVGLPVPDVEMKIMDERGRELPRGETGEICVRGPNVMKGYWKLPVETREAFFGDWFRTGDLGTEDADGYFSILDRKKDMIIVNGMNVYPRMVEEVLYRFPAVREAAVVGEPHALHGEIPVAFVALKPGQAATAAQVRAHCQDSLGRHEIPRKVFFLADLPKNAAGKILKRELRKHGELERGVDSRTGEGGCG
ncbi:MAG: long-chain fatty acid--CoA ligase [Lentisphaerae bacterium]|nr:long-chain fatty acid--CoA ligase [Lentisphaerota bacterium]